MGPLANNDVEHWDMGLSMSGHAESSPHLFLVAEHGPNGLIGEYDEPVS